MPKIILVAGARPNFMKIAPIARELRAICEKESSNDLWWQIVHTGQHYDYEMSRAFFEDLDIPEPDHFLNAGSGSHAEQTAKVMLAFEAVCINDRPDMVIVVGDVNSTLACSVTAKKMGIRVAHVEAGLRSRDMTMPEEINRMVTDAISDCLFVTEKSGIENLKGEGRSEKEIFFVGNVMIDTLYYHLESLSKPDSVKNSKYTSQAKGPYGAITLHRPSNVDDKTILTGIIQALAEISLDMPLLFPAHPRTKKNIDRFGLGSIITRSNIEPIPPLPYLEFLNIWRDAHLVLTDSGGLQEETTALGIPCFTIRENTERPITIEEGTNTLVGTTKDGILAAYANFKKKGGKKGRVPELWDGKAAQRILAILREKLRGC